MHASNWTRKQLEVVKRIKTILSKLQEINLPWVLRKIKNFTLEEAFQVYKLSSFNCITNKVTEN